MTTTTNNTATTMKIFTIETSTWGLDNNNKLYTTSTEVVEVVAENVWAAFKMVEGDSKSCKGSREITIEPQPIEEPAMVEECFEVAPLTTEEKEEFAAFTEFVAVQKEEQFAQMTNDFRQIRYGFEAGESRAENSNAEQLIKTAIEQGNISDVANKFFKFSEGVFFKVGKYDTLEIADIHGRVCRLSVHTKGLDLWLTLPMSGKEGFLGEFAELVDCEWSQADIKYLLYYAAGQPEYKIIIENYTNEN